MTQNEIDVKLQAARILGLTINQRFEKVGGSLFKIDEIKKDNIVIGSYSIPVDKTKTLENLTSQKTALEKYILQIDNNIAIINGS